MLVSDLSFVQYKILANFLNARELSYSQAQPEGVDNDLYKYHLKTLITDGLVQKSETGYALTTEGQSLVQTLNVYGQPQDLFHVSVLLVVTRDTPAGKEILGHKRTRQPYLGDIETVAGKVRHGEEIETAAARKLAEETGLNAVFKLCGVVRKLRYLPDKTLFQDTIYHVCTVNNPKGSLIEKNEWGENFWTGTTKFLELFKKNVTYSPVSEKIVEDILGGENRLFYVTEKLTLGVSPP